MNGEKISVSVFVISFCSFFVVFCYEMRVDILRGISERCLSLMSTNISGYDVFYLCLCLIMIASLIVFMLSDRTEEEKE